MNSWDGVLLVDKPIGWTSHDVVAKVRRLLSKEADKKIKVGHTGTLDPAASGLLLLVIGAYTKRAAQFSKFDKTYEAEITIGAKSTTGDSEGQITTLSHEQPSQKKFLEVLSNFIGQIEQTPPAYSAVKVSGQRAYDLARKGQAPKLKPRKVMVYDIDKVNYKYPKASFTVTVSSGTYIRSLAEDIGEQLGTGAYLSSLRRTKIGNYNISEAISSIDKTDESSDMIFKSLSEVPRSAPNVLKN